MPSDIGLPTYESLLQTALDALPEGEDRSENTLYYQEASAFALLGNELMIGARFVYDAMDINNRRGRELDAFIGDYCKLTRRLAKRAEGEVTFTGKVGAYIPQGTLVAAGDEQFATLWGDTIKEGGTVNIDVQAVKVGNIGYFAAGAIDKIVTNTLVNITGVTNAKPLINGVDEETDDAFRTRYRWHLQHFPYNLNDSTLREWSAEVDGIGQVRIAGKKGSGNITVYALDNNYEPASEQLITSLQAHIAGNLFYGFNILVTAPTAEVVPIGINVKKTDDSLAATVKEALERHIKTYPDPNYVRTDLSVWEVINVVEKVTNMDNINDITVGDGSKPVYTLSATDGSKLLSIGDINVTVG